jgi:hypothetical protein
LTSYKDWTRAEQEAVTSAFEAWAENQYDDMRAGGGQSEQDIADWDELTSTLRDLSVEVLELCRHDLRALENAAWVALDSSGVLPDDEIEDDFYGYSLADLRHAAEVAGWGQTWREA